MTEGELTILSLVAEKPGHGHDIQQLIDERDLREWVAIGFSSVYYILNKLEEQGLVSSTLLAAGAGPARKFYTITDAGRGLLQTAMQERLSQPRALGSGFELGLANLSAMTPLQAYKALYQHWSALALRLARLESAWEKHQQDRQPQEHIRALYTYSIATTQTELEWLTGFLSEWQERYPQVTKPAADNEPPPPHVLQRLKRPPRPRED